MSIDTNAKVVKYLNQDYTLLKEQCLSSGLLFTDEAFPAEPKSLGFKELGPESKKAKGIKWLRPKDLCWSPKFIMGEADRTDICQGELGDCWLLAAISSLTLNLEILKRVVPKGQSYDLEYAGIFHFQLWQYGQWVDVVVDDHLPTRNGKLLFVHSAGGQDFWSALLEKAYAKVNGSYEALSEGRTIEAFEDFTGGIAECYDLNVDQPFLFPTIRKALYLGSLLSCSINSSNSTEMDRLTSLKLVQGHAYSITAADRVHYNGSVVELVRIRNPWGEMEWKGPWGSKSKEWNNLDLAPEYKQLNNPDENGEFWMSYVDFKRYFSGLNICNLSPDMVMSGKVHRWSYCKFEGIWIIGSTAGGCRNNPATYCINPQFFIHLKDVDEYPNDGENGCTILIGLMQKNARKKKRFGQHLHCIGFYVFEVPDEYKGGSNVRLGPDVLLQRKPVFYTKIFSKSREVYCRLKLPPGKYAIIPSTFDPDCEGSFILRVFAEKQYTTRCHCLLHWVHSV
ncbi:calpain-2 catalytic subunit-like [Scomber japonicus]|uniref:calpain-2 catalytic subunit-like n=1 Tax=Scomber japonicus TaxID=13676 RepID=UPI0023052795|nr:calpain-2 catalytic subunit-like [Scomber japonicus]